MKGAAAKDYTRVAFRGKEATCRFIGESKRWAVLFRKDCRRKKLRLNEVWTLLTLLRK